MPPLGSGHILQAGNSLHPDDVGAVALFPLVTVVDDVAGTLLVVEVLTLSDFAVAAVVTPLYAERTLEPV